MLTNIPKIAPDCIPRPEIEDWLDRHRAASVRVIAGQPGSGKTTAVARWARTHLEGVAWISVPPAATRSDLCALLLCALEPADSASVHAALATTAKKHIVIDGADHAGSGARAFLRRLVVDAPQGIGFIFIVRATAAFDLFRLISAGLVVVLDSSALRFAENDVEQLCAVHGISAPSAFRSALITETDGWALAVAGTIRHASCVSGLREGAFQRWLAASLSFVEDVINEAMASASSLAMESFHRILTGEDEPDRHVLMQLAEAGLFVDIIDGEPRFNPVLTAVDPLGRYRSQIGPATLQMFGRFRMTVGDHEVVFARRRDRQIVQFLALTPEGSATRSELLKAFWRDADPQVAGAALRTTCSTIRRSIAARVGKSTVDMYFQVEGTVIRLRLANVVNTAQRFKAHVEFATAAEDRGETEAAYAHWSAAKRLHVAPLLSGEPPEDWIERARRHYDRLASNTRRRCAELAYLQTASDPEQHLTA